MERYAFGREISKKNTLLVRVDTLYQVAGSPLGAMTCNTTLQSELYHHCLHSFIIKPFLDARKVVIGMPDFKDDHEGVCQGCAEGKHTGGPFASSVTKTSDILQLIHSDLSSVLPITSLGGRLYYITFIDDFSRKTWIYFLKKKDEAFNVPHLQGLG